MTGREFRVGDRVAQMVDGRPCPIRCGKVQKVVEGVVVRYVVQRDDGKVFKASPDRLMKV